MEIKEEKAIVLDFLPNGYTFDTRPSHLKTAIVQALGISTFALLELVPKKDVMLQLNDEIYIGEGKREEIHHIQGRLPIKKLTTTAKAELEFTVKEIVMRREQYFVDFFNKAQPMSTRMHQLELLPGLGKKHMWVILDAREEKPFESFTDLKSRVKLMPDPLKIIVKRIISEVSGNEKYRLFIE